MSFPRYERYKDSVVEWLGEVPEHWNVCRVRRLFEICKRIAGEEGYDVLSITQKGIRVKDTESGDGQLSMDYSKYQFVEPGDFAMNHMDLLTGYVDISPFWGVTSPDYRVFRTKDAEICWDRYYLYLYQNAYKRRIFFPFGQGSSQLGRWRLPTDEFNSFYLPLPPLSEQHAIAAFLDRETAKIDALITEQQRLVTLLAEKRQAVISHAVTKGLDPDAPMKDSGIEWLGEVPAGREVLALKRVCVLIKDGTHLPPQRVDNGIPLLSVRNVDNGRFFLRDDDSMISEDDYLNLCRSFVPCVDDVLLAIVGATLGKTALVPEGMGNFQIQRSLAVFRCSPEMISKWLYLVFQSRGFQMLLWQYVGFSAQPGIYLGTLAEFRIPVPPLSEQHAAVTFIEEETIKLDALTAEAQRAITSLQERRSALISAAVTGKIDVRGLAAA